MQATGRALARWGLRGTLPAFASELTALPSVGVSECCALSLARSSGPVEQELQHLRKKEELLRTELQQLRKTELLLLSGAPAPRRLLDAAAKLRQGPGPDVWELRYGDSRVLSYVDPMGVVDYTRGWAGAALQAAVDGYRPTAPAPLLVSGLIKTGKSYTQEHVVPAVVAEALRKAGGAHPLERMVVLRLRADTLNRQDGAAALLKNLLELLLDWVQDEHVPVRAGAVQAAMDKLALFAADYAAMGAAIMRFLKAVEVPVLVLCDEVQSLFLPTICGKLDVSGAAYIRNALMKTLLVYGPRTVLWCLTGSSMAQTWVSLADMPPNGYTVITRACAAVLPATHSPLHMDLAWELLQARFPGVDLDLELRHLCPSSIALLTVLVTEWIDANRPKDVAAFVSEFKRAKLVEESRKEWKLGLEAMPEQQRLTVLDLSSPGVGARIDRDLHPGLRRFLEPHSKRRADGRWYLGDAHQREILRLLIKPDGTLRESWSDEEFSASLMELDAARNLQRLGEAAHSLLGPRSTAGGEQPLPWMEAFKEHMQALAANVAGKLVASGGGGAALGPRELWERQEWFQHVLNSQWNSRDRKAHARDPQARGDHLGMLVFYLRLSRNALAHAKPWERESGTGVDVRVLEALPHVLDQSLAEFNELMVSALAVLQLRGQPPGAVGSSGSLTGDTDREGGRGGGAGGRGSSGGGGAGGRGSSGGSGAGRRGSGGGGARGRGSGGGGRARGSVAQAVA